MRIAISGTGSQGKSTLISDFLNQWPNYKRESETYRSLIKEGNFPHSKNTTKDSQWRILNYMIDEMQKWSKTDKIIMDRCPIDNLVYSLWSFEKQTTDIDKEFIDKCIPLVRESLRQLDIIFFIPITKAAPVMIDDNGIRETDEFFIKEIDNIFKMLGAQYMQNFDRNPFFPKGDSPGWIEIFGDRQTRIAMIKNYLDVDGDLIGGTEESLADLINPYDNKSFDENIQQMKDIIADQKNQRDKDIAIAHQRQLIKQFNDLANSRK